jgi:hypothetical protein
MEGRSDVIDLRHIAELNESAVFLLMFSAAGQNYDRAEKKIMEALFRLLLLPAQPRSRFAVENVPVSPPTAGANLILSATSPGGGGEEEASSSFFPSNSRLGSSCLTTTSPPQGTGNLTEEIYMGPFFVKPTSSVAECATILFFNLALIYHNQERGEHCQATGADFYEQSYRQLQLAILEPELSASLMVLAAAICHNMIRILRDQHEVVQTTIWIRRLSAVVTWLESEETINNETDENLMFFRASLSFASMNEFRYAPAA